MKVQRLLAAFIFLAFSAADGSAGDLSKVERVLAREPAYRVSPKYCLLVFGPQAKARVWLVQDRAALYVDRNGNGDLTEPGERVAAEKGDGVDEGEYTFKAGDLREGTRLHKQLTVSVSKLDYWAERDDRVKGLLAKDPKARGYNIRVEAELPGWKGTGVGGRVNQLVYYTDVTGVFQFAGRPQEAPVVHFGGPWQVTLDGRQRLTIGRDTDVVLGVGTPGVGPGAFAWIEYEGVIPEKVFPTLEITYPPKGPGQPPVRQRYELKQRC